MTKTLMVYSAQKWHQVGVLLTEGQNADPLLGRMLGLGRRDVLFPGESEVAEFGAREDTPRPPEQGAEVRVG